ncbi:MAG: Asp-tRNA(Asn)/Glu-tRNA(Gln) amidotransferase subunit GatA [Lactobacillales bacterium]|jgi:aspartyl-tRNA(Asn)/glutamyl-tRNA(Gln) amidotransferase subunit A|nr:Asp-tRNA(Asn)/Glu-tRNA(Gln) amidotransferase subunit GatA [Lactobacillales bacterium]
MDLTLLSIEELHGLLVSREITAVDIVRAYYDRIEASDSAVNAFITLTKEAALEEAAAIDLKGISADDVLAGIPIGIKDNIVTKGVKTTAASKILGNFVPVYDATVIDKINQHDLITLGKLNMDEFAMGGSGETSYFGATHNPWDLTRVPGGSSSGSAAAVAARFAPVTLGSDTGGSIRLPAAFNNIVGMKPTYGRVSRSGLIAFASSLDQIGPLTRRVKDNAYALQAISGLDEKDMTSSGHAVPDFTANIDAGVAGMKIAIAADWLAEGVEPDVKAAVIAAADKFRELGAVVEEVELPNAKYGVAAYYIVASSEASSNLQRFDGIRYGYRTPNFDNLDDVYVNSRSEGFGAEVKRRVMLGTFSLSAGHYDAHFKKAGKIRNLIKNDFDKVFADYDLIIAPTAPMTPYEIGGITDPVTMYMCDIMTIPANLTGNPAMSIPAGFDSKNLPIGLQIIGKHFDEETMYQAAHAFEGATRYFEKVAEI